MQKSTIVLVIMIVALAFSSIAASLMTVEMHKKIDALKKEASDMRVTVLSLEMSEEMAKNDGIKPPWPIAATGLQPMETVTFGQNSRGILIGTADNNGDVVFDASILLKDREGDFFEICRSAFGGGCKEIDYEGYGTVPQITHFEGGKE